MQLINFRCYRDLKEKHVRFGLNEIEKHGLVQPFPVLYEKNSMYNYTPWGAFCWLDTDEFIAQYKFTALVGARGVKKITEHALPFVSSEYAVEDAALKALLESPVCFVMATFI